MVDITCTLQTEVSSFLFCLPGENEEILFDINLNKYTFLGAKILGLLGLVSILSIGFTINKESLLMLSYGQIGLGVFLILYSLYQMLILKSVEMAITSNRVIFKEGVLSTHNEELQLNAIETVEIIQGLLGRILGYGTVKITGKGNSLVLFSNIDDPIYVKKHIADILTK